METISLGNGPDFCMWRGLEIVNYRLNFFVKNKGGVTRKRIIVDRSLAMLARKSKAFLQTVRMPKIKDEDIDHFNENLTLKINDNEREIILQFYLPYDLSISQLSIIVERIEKMVFS